MSTISLPSSLIELAYAAAAGLLIGLERGWVLRDGAEGSRIAGVRTFTLLGLGGGIAALLPLPLSVTVIALLGLSLLLGYERIAAQPNHHSVTATIAGLITLGLGAAAIAASPTLAIAGAALTTVILASREPLHRWLRGVQETEIRAGARFAVIALVLLPLMPDRAMGPYEAWNPHKLWLVVVLISGLSFSGFLFHARAAGRRGIIVTALAAAVVSSTVATVSLARKLDAKPDGKLFEGAIVAANIVMLARVLAIVAIFIPHVLPHLALLLAPACFISLLGSLAGLQGRGSADVIEQPAIPIGNPLDLKAAFGLAAIVGAASLAGHWVLATLGDLALDIVLALIGLFDVDAAVFTISALPTGRIAPLAAATALSLPVLLNMIAKAGLTISFSDHRQGRRPALWLCAAAAASGMALVALS